jgi:hypothetical protein
MSSVSESECSAAFEALYGPYHGVALYHLRDVERTHVYSVHARVAHERAQVDDEAGLFDCHVRCDCLSHS